MELSDDVIEKIKDFNYRELTEEQELLIDELILDEELKERYKNYGMCNECKQPNTDHTWCQSCNAKHFQRNFKNWTSGNHDIDVMIQKAQLSAQRSRGVVEWIEYDRFENVEYLAKGNLGAIHKAIWKDGSIDAWDTDQWKRYKYSPVALKCLHNSQDSTTLEFLKEVEMHIFMSDSHYIVRCYGITKDPKTNNFMMVMEYAVYGNLRQHLDNSFNSLDWKGKLHIIQSIASGLKSIHNSGLIHRDFNCGNILIKYTSALITGFGLCRPANMLPQSGDKQAYRVLPYVAPEVLREKEYTQASDVYGFGIIAYEVCTGLPPYHDVDKDEFLAIKICQGSRPKSDYKVPQLILDLIEQCWDADPLKRPNASEVNALLLNLYTDADQEDSLLNNQIKETDEINKQTSSTGYATPSQAADGEDSDSVRFDFTKSKDKGD